MLNLVLYRGDFHERIDFIILESLISVAIIQFIKYLACLYLN